MARGQAFPPPRLGAGRRISTCCHVKKMFLPICAMSGYGGCACDPVTGRVFGADFLAVGGGIMIRPSFFQFTFWRPDHKPVVPLFPLLPGAMWNTWGLGRLIEGGSCRFPYVRTKCEHLLGRVDQARPLWCGANSGPYSIRTAYDFRSALHEVTVVPVNGVDLAGWVSSFAQFLCLSCMLSLKLLRITSGHFLSRAQGLACSYMYSFVIYFR